MSVIPRHLRAQLLRPDETWDRILDEEGVLRALGVILGRTLMASDQGAQRGSFSELTAVLLAKVIDRLERQGDDR